MSAGRRLTVGEIATDPGEHVHPEVMVAMREVGVDLSDIRPQKLTTALAKETALLVTMGCGESCPVVPGLERDDWPLKTPKASRQSVCERFATRSANEFGRS